VRDLACVTHRLVQVQAAGGALSDLVQGEELRLRGLDGSMIEVEAGSSPASTVASLRQPRLSGAVEVSCELLISCASPPAGQIVTSAWTRPDRTRSPPRSRRTSAPPVAQRLAIRAVGGQGVEAVDTKVGVIGISSP